jgi:signal transduction histidine kinase
VRLFLRKEPPTATPAEVSVPQPTVRWTIGSALRSRQARYVAKILLLAAAYYGSAKAGQSLQYTASVSAVWPPAGVGIAALYLWGPNLWPGVFLAELAVNGELLHSLPLGSLIGQQAGNMAEVIVGAVLLRRLIGPRATFEHSEQVSGTILAIGIATAISATVGTVSMLAGGVISGPEIPKFWRTWWLGDTAGGLVVVPLIVVWASRPREGWRRIRTWEGALLIAAVTALALVAMSINGPLTYVVFPALIWAAFRFGPAGTTLSIAITALVTIAATAHQTGPFFSQPIDHRTLATQAYIVVIAVTTLFLGALVAERAASSRALAEAQRREGERAMEERHRIARDLHDSVSQALFSTALHTRTAERVLRHDGTGSTSELRESLSAIGELTKSAQTEMRALIFQLRRDAVEAGLVSALAAHASSIRSTTGLRISVQGPESRLPIQPRTEEELFAIGREALANVVKHARAHSATVRIEDRPETVVLEIADDGHGFNATTNHPGHFGLETMRGRAAAIDGDLTIASEPGGGTVVRVEVRANGS